jgi:protein TonB
MKNILFIFLLLFSTQINAQDSSKTSAQKEDSDMLDHAIFTKLEIEAVYPGGQMAWNKYLAKNMHYPDNAISNVIQGTVIVKFIVNRDGTISDVVAESGPINGGLREESVRLIKASGNWIPGMQNGHKVRSYKRQPFAFKLQS